MARTPGGTKRGPRAAIEAIEVELGDLTRRSFGTWAARAVTLDEPREPFVRFSDWYPTCEERWLEQAEAQGIWTASSERHPDDARECRHPGDAVGHARRADGLVVHFTVADDAGRLVFRARYCRQAPVFALAQRFTDDQRLTWEEFASGEPCRGCGRGFVGAPERKPVLRRTPEEAEWFEQEEAEFRSRHPACTRLTWVYGPTGVTHCSECCPPPPLGPDQSKRLARILADIILQLHADDVGLRRRWKDAAERSGAAPTST